MRGVFVNAQTRKKQPAKGEGSPDGPSPFPAAEVSDLSPASWYKLRVEKEKHRESVSCCCRPTPPPPIGQEPTSLSPRHDLIFGQLYLKWTLYSVSLYSVLLFLRDGSETETTRSSPGTARPGLVFWASCAVAVVCLGKSEP